MEFILFEMCLAYHSKVNDMWNLRGSFLPASLGSSTEKDTSRLACKLLSSPKTSSSIQKCFELSSHHTESSWEAKNKPIGLGEFARSDYWYIALRWCTHLAKDFLG